MNSSLPFVSSRGLIVLVVILLIAVGIIWWPSCQAYPTVSSQQSLYLMKLLYTACNTENTEKLAKVRQGVTAAATDGKLSQEEEETYLRILELAESGNWDAAEAAALNFAEDQIGNGHPDLGGNSHDE